MLTFATANDNKDASATESDVWLKGLSLRLSKKKFFEIVL